jgi:hypothetical protein
MAGTFTNTVNFGGAPLIEQGTGANLFVAEFDCAGKHLWSKAFGAPDQASDSVLALSVGADGSILMTGTFTGSLDFGTGPLPTTGSGGGFFAKLDAAGSPIYAKSFDGIGTGCAVDGAGNAVYTGHAKPQDFGGGVIGSAGQDNLFTVKLDPTGSHVWSKAFGPAYFDYFGAETPNFAFAKVAVDASNNLILTSGTSGGLDFGGGTLPGSLVYAAKLGPDGSYVWANGWGDIIPGYTAVLVSDVATGSAGEIVMSGHHFCTPHPGCPTCCGTLDFGGGPLVPYSTYFVKLTETGAHVFSKAGSGEGPGVVVNPEGPGVAVNGVGEIYVAGSFDGTIDFGGGPVTSPGGVRQAFFAKLTPTGSLSWLQQFGTSASQGASSIALDGMGTPYVAGTYAGNLDLGNGPLPTEMGTGMPSEAAFVARFAP